MLACGGVISPTVLPLLLVPAFSMAFMQACVEIEAGRKAYGPGDFADSIEWNVTLAANASGAGGSAARASAIARRRSVGESSLGPPSSA